MKKSDHCSPDPSDQPPVPVNTVRLGGMVLRWYGDEPFPSAPLLDLSDPSPFEGELVRQLRENPDSYADMMKDFSGHTPEL